MGKGWNLNYTWKVERKDWTGITSVCWDIIAERWMLFLVDYLEIGEGGATLRGDDGEVYSYSQALIAF